MGQLDNDKALIENAKNGDLESVNRIIATGEFSKRYVQNETHIYQAGQNFSEHAHQTTALIEAIFARHNEVAIALIKAGFDFSQPVKLLFDGGGQASLPVIEPMTAMTYAVYSGRSSVVSAMLDNRDERLASAVNNSHRYFKRLTPRGCEYLSCGVQVYANQSLVAKAMDSKLDPDVIKALVGAGFLKEPYTEDASYSRLPLQLLSCVTIPAWVIPYGLLWLATCCDDDVRVWGAVARPCTHALCTTSYSMTDYADKHSTPAVAEAVRTAASTPTTSLLSPPAGSKTMS